MGFEAVASGVYLEGLCADAESVWVADPLRGGVRRCSQDGKETGFLQQRRWIGGLLRAAGETVLVSGEAGILWLDGATGESGLLPLHGAQIPGVNEMAADAQGRLYFGSLDVASIAAGKQTAPASLYRRDTDGRLTELVTGLRFSNGLALSPDGKRLYHNETFVGTSAYDIRPDGSLGPGHLLLDKPDCDGMAVDAQGTLWVTGFATAAIVRMRPDGGLADPLGIPGGGATNIRFGGADLRDVFITTVAAGAAAKLAQGLWPEVEDSLLNRGRSDVPGLALPRPVFPRA